MTPAVLRLRGGLRQLNAAVQTQPRRRRLVWRLAVGWCGLHLIGLLAAILFMPDFTRAEVREWSDIGAYFDAGDAWRTGQPLYELDTWEDPMTYYYHPAFAAAFSLPARLPFRLVAALWLILQAAAYFAALWTWHRVTLRLGLPRIAAAYRLWLPLAFVLTDWFANLGYGNLTSALLLLSGALTLALLDERPGAAALLALPVALVKPQWLFPLILPVVFRRWRLLLHVGVRLALVYTAVCGLIILAGGADYGLQALRDYGSFLTSVNDHYQWGGHTYDFENMNHSWRQILHSYAGSPGWVPAAAEGIKLGMIGLAAFPLIRVWRRKVTLNQQPELALWFSGLAYLLAMALLAQLWEIMGSIVFFLFLQASSSRNIRRVSWLYGLYALYEIPVILSLITGWDILFLPQSVPLTMLALLLLYGLLLAETNRQLVSLPVVQSEKESIE